MQFVRLSSRVVFEPLVNRFHASWLTVAPLTCAFETINGQLPRLQSFLDNAEAHWDAATKVAGSPAFICLPPQQKDFVGQLVRKLESSSLELTKFVADAQSFAEVVLKEAKGGALTTIYERMPSSLRGYAEVVYDYFARPSVRFEEGLLYGSPYYRQEFQEVSAFVLQKDDRTFAMSTPRPPSNTLAEVRIPFADRRWSDVFALDRATESSRAIEVLKEAALDHVAESLLEPCGAPTAETSFAMSPGTVRVRYFGHATLLVSSAGDHALVDPVISAQPHVGMPRFSFADVPERLRYVLITHMHYDHFALETLLRLLPRVETLVVPRSFGLCGGDVSMRRVAQQLGYQDVREIDTGDSLLLGDGEITALPFWGEHGDIAHGSRATYLYRDKKQSILFLADAVYQTPEIWEHVVSQFGRVRTIFMNTETDGAPVGWGGIASLLPRRRDTRVENSRRCRGSNMKEALEVVRALGATDFVNYAMGLEPWVSFLLGPPPERDSARMVESDRLLGTLRDRGLARVERPLGRAEFIFD